MGWGGLIPGQSRGTGRAPRGRTSAGISSRRPEILPIPGPVPTEDHLEGPPRCGGVSRPHHVPSATKESTFS